jgi:hypothetical protein
LAKFGEEGHGDGVMSLGGLLTVLGAATIAGAPAPPERYDFLDLSGLTLTPQATMLQPVLPIHWDDAGEPPRGQLWPARSSPLELVVYVGDRRCGPQLELGALGGGRADAPGLVHVGFGFDF